MGKDDAHSKRRIGDAFREEHDARIVQILIYIKYGITAPTLINNTPFIINYFENTVKKLVKGEAMLVYMGCTLAI